MKDGNAMDLDELQAWFSFGRTLRFDYMGTEKAARKFAGQIAQGAPFALEYRVTERGYPEVTVSPAGVTEKSSVQRRH